MNALIVAILLQGLIAVPARGDFPDPALKYPVAKQLQKDHDKLWKRFQSGKEDAKVSTEIDKLLKKNPELVKAYSPDGWTALHYAAYAGHAALVDLLVARGAKLDARAPNGRTALMLAAQAGHADVMTALRRAGADATLVDYDGKTAAAIAKDPGTKRASESLGNRLQ